jgi:CubicO group peptidase (beta-lactamase class C family)
MQPEMLFRLGSTTKMFTVAALLTLAEQNKIKMKEPIGNRVKGLNGRVGQVTTHHLLSNSAGVRDFVAPVISSDDPALSNMVRSWKEDVFFADQGEIYSYSSPGFWLSGYEVEELYGKPYAGETDSYYGYGLTIFKYKDYEFVLHGGFSRGYGSMIQMVPSRKFAGIVLTNKSGETMRKTLNKATQLALGLKDDAPEKPATIPPPTTSEMNEYVGTYSHAPNTWDVSMKDGKLHMNFDDKDSVMTKTGKKKFSFGEQNENEVVFVPGKSGKIEFLFFELYGAKKIK